MVPHTFKQQGHLPSIKGDFIQRVVSVSVFPSVSANDACCTRFLTLTPSAPDHSFALSVIASSSSLFLSLSLFLPLPFVVFVWLLGFVCLLFPDGRCRLHLCGFQVPRELFTALAQALILFPLAGLYDGPFIHSNWKQLLLPVCVGESRRKPRESVSFSVHSPSEHLH